jgi:acyl carrier protein
MPEKYSDKKLKKIFYDEIKIKVKTNSKIYDFKTWDSLGNFNILLRCEKEFKIKFTSKEFTSLNSFKEIEKVVKKK